MVREITGSGRPGRATAGRDAERRLRPFAVLLVVAAALVNLVRFPGAGRDDVFITLFAGETLGRGPWFLNFNYEPEEMMTSVLGALVAAFLHALVPEGTYTLNKLFTYLVSVGTLVLLWRARRVLFGKEGAEWPAVFSVAATGFLPVFGYWGLSGLESVPYGFLLLLYVVVFGLYVREGRARQAAGLVTVQILLVLVRAEGFWILAATAVLGFLVRLRPRQVAVLVGLPLLAFGVLLALRHHMTGGFWPNPVYAKAGDLSSAVPRGFRYLRGYYSASPLLSFHLFALLGGFAAVVRATLGRLGLPGGSVRTNPVVLAAATLVLAYESFVLLVGGNWMEYYRFLAPTVPLKNVLLAVLALPLWTGVVVGRGRQILGGVLVAVFVLAQQWMPSRTPLTVNKNCSSPLPLGQPRLVLENLFTGATWLNCAHRRDNFSVVPFVREELRKYVPPDRPLTVVTYQAGYFPYLVRKYFGPDEVYFLGTPGLINRRIAVLPVPKDFLGLKGASRPDWILAGKAGPLSEAIDPEGPVLVYVLHANPVEARNYEAMGFRRVWSGAGADVFYIENRTPLFGAGKARGSRSASG